MRIRAHIPALSRRLGLLPVAFLLLAPAAALPEEEPPRPASAEAEAEADEPRTPEVARPEGAAASPESPSAAEPPGKPSYWPPEIPWSPGLVPPSPARAAVGGAPAAAEGSPIAFQLGVGGFAGSGSPGLALDLGIRAKMISLRGSWRTTTTGDGDTTLTGIRADWNRPLSRWAVAFVGGGFDGVDREGGWADDGTYASAASATAATLEAGLLFEYGLVSVASLGVEIRVPIEGEAKLVPPFMLVASINPLLLLKGL